MHINPESSFARSGFSSTVIENNIGQMLAKPRPAATTPANASGLRSDHECSRAQQAKQGGKPETSSRTHH